MGVKFQRVSPAVLVLYIRSLVYTFFGFCARQRDPTRNLKARVYIIYIYVCACACITKVPPSRRAHTSAPLSHILLSRAEFHARARRTAAAAAQPPSDSVVLYIRYMYFIIIIIFLFSLPLLSTRNSILPFALYPPHALLTRHRPPPSHRSPTGS